MRGRSIRSGKLKGLRRFTQDGTRYVYHRATGTRLPDLPENHPDFLAAYLAAENQRPSVKPLGRGKPGSILAAWHAYCTSDDFKRLSRSYQQVRKRDGAKLIEAGGAVMIRSIREYHIQNDLDKLKPHPARERRKTWRALMAFANRQKLIDKNPALNVQAQKPPKAKQHEPWSNDAREAFRDHWPIGTMQRLFFEIVDWTGARVSDGVRLGDGMVTSDGWLEFTQQKTGGPVWIPLYREPPTFADADDLAYLIAALDARPQRHMTWLTTAYGASRSEKSVSQWFSAAARAAGLTGLTGHGLRVSRAIRLAEAGATTHQIGAWTGHESLKEIEHYSRQADRKRLLMGPEVERQNVQVKRS